jgi:hypothetical protein
LLKGTRVTDAALDDLATLTGCSLLNLEKTRITDAGVAKLKAIMPQTTIFCR